MWTLIIQTLLGTNRRSTVKQYYRIVIPLTQSNGPSEGKLLLIAGIKVLKKQFTSKINCIKNMHQSKRVWLSQKQDPYGHVHSALVHLVMKCKTKLVLRVSNDTMLPIAAVAVNGFESLCTIQQGITQVCSFLIQKWYA